jgi:hypothetical protein
VFASHKERRTTHQGTISACERRSPRFLVWRRRRRNGLMAAVQENVRSQHSCRGARVNWPDALPQPDSANDQQRQRRREQQPRSSGGLGSKNYLHPLQTNRMPGPCCDSMHVDPSDGSTPDTRKLAAWSRGPSWPASGTRVVCFDPHAYFKRLASAISMRLL